MILAAMKRCRRLPMLVLLAMVGFGPAGCYEHVIRAEGFGAADIDTYEPNRPEPGDDLDRFMYGNSSYKDRDKKRK